MASGYALPNINGSKHARGHAAFPSLDYSEASHSTHHHHDHHEVPTTPGSSNLNGTTGLHSQKLPSKGRARGESDLGRPVGAGFVPVSTRASLLVEIFTGALLTLQYALITASYKSSVVVDSLEKELKLGSQNKDAATAIERSPIWAHTGLITAAILIAAGASGYMAASPESTEKRRLSNAADKTARNGAPSALNPKTMLRTAVSAALPIYASLCLAKSTTGLFLVAAVVSVTGLGSSTQARPGLGQKVTKSVGFWLVMALSMAADLAGLASSSQWYDIIQGYACLFIAICLLTPPFLDLPPFKLKVITSTRPLEQPSVSWSKPNLIISKTSSTCTVLSGAALGSTTLIAVLVSGAKVSFSPTCLLLAFLGVITTCITALFGDVASLNSRRRAGLLAGLAVALLSLEISRSSSRTKMLSNCALALGTVLGATFDSSGFFVASSDKSQAHTGHKHHHHGNVSFLTSFLLSKTSKGSLIYDVLSEKDSRRIAYFTCLNFAFMMVQGFYGWVSGSLGLLSDTVHMFFDCLALIIGLAASVASKWPTSPEKPYGWGKLNTLAGFGNGVFLMLVSVEFVWGAIEGIMEQTELRRVQELLVVSSLGLIVNMVGLLAFGHAHVGHDHGHSHGHSHGHHHGHDHGHSHNDVGHSHSHSHAHHDHGHEHGDHNGAGCNGNAHSHTPVHDHGHSISHPHVHNPSPLRQHEHEHDHDHHDHHHDNSVSHSHPQSHVHGHAHSHASTIPHVPTGGSLYPPKDSSSGHVHSGHENDNLHGIYLHIAADAGGSLAVIISTTLTLWKPWYLWDPLATIIIAVLIFMAAVPLVKESAKKLLLVIPEELEYELKNALQELVMLRGVTGFAAPRFWIEDKGGDGGHGHHHHGHDHAHGAEGHQATLQGVIHVFASRAASVEDVRERVEQFFTERGMELVVQVEREGEGRCWCGGSGN